MDDDIWDKVDEGMENSTLRQALRTNSNRWEPLFTKSLNSLFFQLKRDYSFEMHCITYACLAFSKIAGYDRDDDLEKPDFSRFRMDRASPYMKRYGGSIPDYFKKFEGRIVYELSLRLANLNTKKLECRDEDRLIAFACLAFCLVNKPSTVWYRKGSAYEAFDNIIAEYGFEPEFNEHLR